MKDKLMKDDIMQEALQYIMERDIKQVMDELEQEPELKTSTEFEQKMEILIQKTNRRYVTVGKYTMRRLALVAILAALFLTGCVVIKPVREAILNYWSEMTDEATNIHMQLVDAGGIESKVLKITPPDGYSLVSENSYEDLGDYSYEYLGPNGEFLYYSQDRIGDVYTISIDTENADVYEMEIIGQTISCVTKDNWSHVYWKDETDFYHLRGDCDIKAIVEIVEKMLRE